MVAANVDTVRSDILTAKVEDGHVRSHAPQGQAVPIDGELCLQGEHAGRQTDRRVFLRFDDGGLKGALIVIAWLEQDIAAYG